VVAPKWHYKRQRGTTSHLFNFPYTYYFRSTLKYNILRLYYTGYVTSDNESGGIENATHNTLERKLGHGGDKYPAFPPNVLWVAFSIPPGISLVI
jgi:hypothetical protein